MFRRFIFLDLSAGKFPTVFKITVTTLGSENLSIVQDYSTDNMYFSHLFPCIMASDCKIQQQVRNISEPLPFN